MSRRRTLTEGWQDLDDALAEAGRQLARVARDIVLAAMVRR